MRGTIALLIASPFILGLSSCMKQGEPEKKPVGPPGTETSKIPWNTPIAGQGQGQFGMMESNRYRR
jgi:hypothetical protein